MLRLLKSKEHRELIGFIAAGVAALAAGGWAVFTYVHPGATSSEKGSIIRQEGSCAVMATGSITTQSISLTCGASADEIKKIVAEAVSGPQLLELVNNAQSGKGETESRTTALANKLGIKPDDVNNILIALGRTDLTAEQSVDQFTQVSSEYIQLKSQYDQLVADGAPPDALGTIATSLSSGNFAQAAAYLAVARKIQAPRVKRTSDGGVLSECDGSSDTAPIKNATFEESQIFGGKNRLSLNYYSAINLDGSNYRDRDLPFPISVDTRYRAFIRGPSDMHFFTFTISEGVALAEFQIRNFKEIRPRIVIADAVTGTAIVKGEFNSDWDTVDFKVSAKRYNLEIEPREFGEPASNYCFAISTIETGQDLSVHFVPESNSSPPSP